MNHVEALRHEEGVRLDAARLVALVSQYGDGGAAGVVSRAMEDMAECLARMEAHYREGETRVICRNARRLAALASEVGMTSLARVAADVNTCAGRGDMVAFAATWARLQRIADRSLSAIWDIQGSAV
jgi:hypothetical protein